MATLKESLNQLTKYVLISSFNTIEECDEHSKDHQIHEDGFRGQVCSR